MKLLALLIALIACTVGLHVATKMMEAKDARHAYVAIPCLMIGAVVSVETIRTVCQLAKESA